MEAMIVAWPARKRRRRLGRGWALLMVGMLAAATTSAHGEESETLFQLGSPVDCLIGEDCFVQQMPDIDPNGQALDPTCGGATNNGHDGWDIRVRSFKDIARPTRVIAVADGIVLRIRDGVADRIHDHEADKDMKGRECGNGVIMEHAGGLVSQSCHLKNGSIGVAPGTRLKKGAILGLVGASGLAEFPHVHLSVRRDGKPIDPLTGRFLGVTDEACGDTTKGLFEPTVRDSLKKSTSAILSIGLANARPALSRLVRDGDPAVPTIFEPLIAWVWAINVEKDSAFKMRLIDPDGKIIMDTETKSVASRKANYLAYAGERYVQRKGIYELKVDLNSGAQTIRSSAQSIFIGR
jgi:hypothetical protein